MVTESQLGSSIIDNSFHGQSWFPTVTGHQKLVIVSKCRMQAQEQGVECPFCKGSSLLLRLDYMCNPYYLLCQHWLVTKLLHNGQSGNSSRHLLHKGSILSIEISCFMRYCNTRGSTEQCPEAIRNSACLMGSSNEIWEIGFDMQSYFPDAL